MPHDSWPTLFWTTLVLVSIGLAVLGVLGAILIMNLRLIRRQVEERMARMAQRLRVVEGLVDQVERNAGSSVSDHPRARPSDRTPLKAWRKESAVTAASIMKIGGGSDPRTKPTLIAIPDLAALPKDPARQAESELGQRHAEVWALADSGSSPEEIARHTGQPIGQVELILGLYRQLQGNRGSAGHARSQ
jgi:hypothetical protein